MTPLSLQVTCHQKQCLGVPIIGHYLRFKVLLSHRWGPLYKSNLNKEQQEQLDALLEKVTGSGSDDKWRYQITLLKKSSQSMQPKKIKENVTDLNDLLTLYLQFKSVIIQLGLSYECLHYYAHSVIKSRIHQVSRREEDSRYLHLLAFIVYKTLKLQDLLIDTMLLAVQATINATMKSSAYLMKFALSDCLAIVFMRCSKPSKA